MQHPLAQYQILYYMVYLQNCEICTMPTVGATICYLFPGNVHRPAWETFWSSVLPRQQFAPLCPRVLTGHVLCFPSKSNSSSLALFQVGKTLCVSVCVHAHACMERRYKHVLPLFCCINPNWASRHQESTELQKVSWTNPHVSGENVTCS